VRRASGPESASALRDWGPCFYRGFWRANAFFGPPRGHSLGKGSRSLIGSNVPGMLTLESDGLAPCCSAPERAQRLRSHRVTSRQFLVRRAWSYSLFCFHIASVRAASLRATVSLALFGLVPASSKRS
jgi:hypothetical protein